MVCKRLRQWETATAGPLHQAPAGHSRVGTAPPVRGELACYFSFLKKESKKNFQNMGTPPTPPPSHDDAEREFDYTVGAEKALEIAGTHGWAVASMREDWIRIFD